MRKTSGIIVRKTTCETPGSQWKVDGLRAPDGRRQRKFFGTKGEADHFAQVARLRREHEGRSGEALSHDERNEAALCLSMLKERGKTLIDATRHYLAYLEREQRAITVEKLIEEFIPAKRQDGVSAIYLKTLKSTVDRFAVDHGAQSVGEMLPHEIDDWLRDLDVSNSSRNSYRAMIAAFFAYAVARGYALANPVAKVAKAKAAVTTIERLSPEQTRRLLVKAPVAVVPHLAVAAFAGLRDAEIKRLDWSEIHLDREHPVIEVKAENAKTGSRRTIPIQPNLAAWLAPHRRKKGPLSPAGARDHIEAARQAAGLTEDGTADGKLFAFDNHLRHSYATYRMPVVADAPRVASEMGNTPQIMHKHYRDLASLEEAQAYWKIFP